MSGMLLGGGSESGVTSALMRRDGVRGGRLNVGVSLRNSAVSCDGVSCRALVPTVSLTLLFCLDLVQLLSLHAVAVAGVVLRIAEGWPIAADVVGIPSPGSTVEVVASEKFT